MEGNPKCIHNGLRRMVGKPRQTVQNPMREKGQKSNSGMARNWTPDSLESFLNHHPSDQMSRCLHLDLILRMRHDLLSQFATCPLECSISSVSVFITTARAHGTLASAILPDKSTPQVRLLSALEVSLPFTRLHRAHVPPRRTSNLWSSMCLVTVCGDLFRALAVSLTLYA